ncbi:MAG: polysulfide reductase NrfD, partial [Burkholderiales bacterium]|nr:polysulfide reductase NrfD [Burkholderiales bacterium]
MNFESLHLTSQVAVAHWSWMIAFFLWFVGLGGMGLFVNMWAKSKTIFYISTVCGILGTCIVVLHLARMTNLPFAAFYALLDLSFNLHSWMFIGICLLATFCLWTFIQSICLLGYWKAPKLANFIHSKCGYLLNGVLGLCATAYSGFLLTQAQGVSFWTTAMIPTLWVISGLSCSLGLIEFLVGTNKLDYEQVPWITKTSNVADSLEAVAIFALVLVAFSGDAGSVAGAHRMVSGEGACMFWGGAIFLGIVMPLFINLTYAHSSRRANIVGGTCGVFGALVLRASVLMAGY